MKRLGLLLALALLVGCGGSSPTIDGNWSGVSPVFGWNNLLLRFHHFTETK